MHHSFWDYFLTHYSSFETLYTDEYSLLLRLRSTPPRPLRPSSKKRKAGDFAEVVVHNQGTSSLNTRLNTSSTVITLDNRANLPLTPSLSNPLFSATTSHQWPTYARKESLQSSSRRRHLWLKQRQISSPRELPKEEYVPALRRPAISYQHSVTLQQQF
jgi:hypothetical protein